MALLCAKTSPAAALLQEQPPLLRDRAHRNGSSSFPLRRPAFLFPQTVYAQEISEVEMLRYGVRYFWLG